MNIPVKEEALEIEDIIDSIKNNTLTEAFGSGTVAVVVPISELIYKNKNYRINYLIIGPNTQILYKSLTDFQYGTTPDSHNWMTPVD